MLKILMLSLFIVIGLSAQTEVSAIIGGAGSGSHGAGNINGTGSSAAVNYPKAVAKSIDNQLLVGDKYGLKKVNIQTNTISTLHPFENANFHDIEVDSSGNIYAGVSIWIDDPKACNNTQYTFLDTRIYKFSSTGTILEIWGSACESSDVDFEDFGVYIAIDENDVVYAMSAWTPELNSRYGTHSTIKKVNANGTLSKYEDVLYGGEKIEGIQELEYHNNKFYIANGAYIDVFTPGNSELERIYAYNDNGPSGIEFDENGHMYLAYGNVFQGIERAIFHNNLFHFGSIAGGVDNYTAQNKILPTDERLYTSVVDALDVSFFGMSKVVKIEDELFFSDDYYHRIMKLVSPSNEEPTLALFDFPKIMRKNAYNLLKFNANDSDGYSTRLYCDLDDGKGEQSIWNSFNGKYSNQIRTYGRYETEGEKTISCTLYDNEGAYTTLSKTFKVGDDDNDGIFNTRELELGLNPSSNDSDADGILDNIEIGDVNNPQDTDGDGVIDALDDDSDNDGISDADEIKTGTNPLIPNNTSTEVKNDFNNDGVADILWKKGSYYSVWYMNANGTHTYKYLSKVLESKYTLVQSADFNGDGISDFIWKNGSYYYVWYMKANGTHTYKYLGKVSENKYTLIQ